MTEITNNTDPSSPAPLHPAVERFVLHWGEMGGQWGVNRSVSQIHALLYVSARPLAAEEIAAVLGIARSNVSNSLKELITWELIRRVPIRGDRREHYEAETDVWVIMRRIAAGRKAREIDPALATLRACVAQSNGDSTIHPVAAKRLADMLAFTQNVDAWTTQMLAVPTAKLASLLKLGAKIIRFLPTGKSGL